MRNMLALFGLVVLVAVGVGWYQGWYQVSKEAANDDDVHLSLQIKPKKVEQSLEKGAHWVGDTIQDISNRVGSDKPADPAVKPPASSDPPKPNAPWPNK